MLWFFAAVAAVAGAAVWTAVRLEDWLGPRPRPARATSSTRKFRSHRIPCKRANATHPGLCLDGHLAARRSPRASASCGHRGPEINAPYLHLPGRSPRISSPRISPEERGQARPGADLERAEDLRKVKGHQVDPDKQLARGLLIRARPRLLPRHRRQPVIVPPDRASA